MRQYQAWRAEAAIPCPPARSLPEEVKQPLDDLQHEDQELEDMDHPLHSS
jgi:hypothetical protein